MKKIKYFSSIVLFSFLSVALFSCKDKKSNNDSTVTTSENSQQYLNIAYVNMDSVYAQLEYFNEMKEELRKMEANMTSELQGLQRGIINTQNNLQTRIKNKDISEVEMQSIEKKLISQNNNLQKKQESLTAQFMQKQNAMAMEIEELTNAFFKEYNTSKGYDLILANNQVKTVFYADEKLEITSDVTTAFNEFVAKAKRNMVINKTLGNMQNTDTTANSDTTKK